MFSQFGNHAAYQHHNAGKHEWNMPQLWATGLGEQRKKEISNHIGFDTAIGNNGW